MWKTYAASIGLATSLGITSMHYVSHGWIATEEFVLSRYERIKDARIEEIAASNGYVKQVPDRSWEEIAEEQAQARKLNACLVKAVVKVESAGGKQLISRAGALGHMQLMSGTAQKVCGIKNDMGRLDPETNIYCGVKYLDSLLKQYGPFKALQVYNAGPARVGATQENREYPHKVLKEWVRCESKVS